ncbi:unnamed protein product, partial [Rotaria sp. Silwood1]
QMNKKQIELIEFWNKSPKPPMNVLVSHENEQHISASSCTSESIPSCILDEPVNEIVIISSESPCSSSNILDNHDMSFSIQQENSNKSQLNKKSSTIVRRKYLSAWEKQPDAMYKTYVFDQLGERRENFLSWLYFKDNAMRCSLCEKHGKENIWCTVGNQIFQLYKIKEHKHKSEVHRHAEETELKISARTQPTWIETRAKQISKQEQAVQNLILASIHICRQYQSLNSLEQLCVLLEKLGVQLLPSQISGVNYRNNDVALSFLQHVAYYLHEELIEKIKSSPAIGWMMDESTSRTVEKSCIVYVRYLENYHPKTAYYTLLDMEGDGTAANIVETISSVWRKDDLDPVNSCWFACDNASTFTGINEGVVAKLRRHFQIDWLETNTCAAHSFCLVGNRASWTIDLKSGKPVIIAAVSKLETTIGKIYNYFGRSSTRQQMLKEWQNFLDMPELKFKRIYDIRWSSIRGNQALLAALQQNASDPVSSNGDRGSAKELFQYVLNDEFLFLLHFHYDLHECALGPITKLMQFDKLSYYSLMKEIKEKKNLISQWISKSTPTWGPALADYIKTTEKRKYGAFKIDLSDRQELAKECSAHIERLLIELDKRFAPSRLLESMTILFDPIYLIEHKKDVDSPDYGRPELDFIRNKYKDFPGLDTDAVRSEWETLKPSLCEFLDSPSSIDLKETFWQQFLLLKQAINSRFLEENKNLLALLSIYLIVPTNSVECERG